MLLAEEEQELDTMERNVVFLASWRTEFLQVWCKLLMFGWKLYLIWMENE
jgi:hypothetical protein